MAMTAIDLSNSTYLSDKTELRNVLQKNIGELKTKSNSLSVAQLRQQKKKMRKIDGNVTRNVLSLDNIPTFDYGCHLIQLNQIVVTPLEKNNNKRWYRNRLSEIDDLVDDNFASTISSKSSNDLKSVKSCDEDENVTIDSLHNKVIMKLINISSPASKNKQKLFENVVEHTDNTRVILEMAIKMGSLGKDTKTMLMNNYI